MELEDLVGVRGTRGVFGIDVVLGDTIAGEDMILGLNSTFETSDSSSMGPGGFL